MHTQSATQSVLDYLDRAGARKSAEMIRRGQTDFSDEDLLVSILCELSSEEFLDMIDETENYTIAIESSLLLWELLRHEKLPAFARMAVPEILKLALDTYYWRNPGEFFREISDGLSAELRHEYGSIRTIQCGYTIEDVEMLCDLVIGSADRDAKFRLLSRGTSMLRYDIGLALSKELRSTQVSQSVAA